LHPKSVDVLAAGSGMDPNVIGQLAPMAFDGEGNLF
jgi:hypothetical protein